MLTLSCHVPLPTHKEHQPPHVRKRRGWTLGTDPHRESQQLQPLLGSADLASRKSVFRGRTKPIMHSWVCLSLLITSHQQMQLGSWTVFSEWSNHPKNMECGLALVVCLTDSDVCSVLCVICSHHYLLVSPLLLPVNPFYLFPPLASPLEKMTVFPSALWKGMGSPWWQERAQP